MLIRSATATPNFGTVGNLGTWQLDVVLETPIEPGGRVCVQFPESWNTGPWNGAQGVHAIDPTHVNYVSATAQAAGPGAVSCKVVQGSTDEVVKPNRLGLDGRQNRYVWVIEVTAEAHLAGGETVSVVLGDRTGGSSGYRAGWHTNGLENVMIAVAPAADDDPELVPAELQPTIQLRAGEPEELVATLPSIAGVGDTGELHIAVIDGFANAVDHFTGEVSVELHSGSCAVAASAAFGPDSGGVMRIPVEFTTPGVVRLEAAAAGLESLSNPTEVTPEAPAHHLYWGDLHSHAHYSFDGTGDGSEEYAEDVAALDFLSRTDHSEGWTGNEWDEIRALAAAHNKPGRFVTILGYEATFGGPWGHHNVFFRGDDGPIAGADRGNVLDLWDAIAGLEAFTIPHHSGIEFKAQPLGNVPGNFTPNPDWRIFSGGMRPAIEIYSLHGLSERYDPAHPLAYENCDFSLSWSGKGPHYAQDAWRAGHVFAVTASSDNHRAQPGRGEGGLAAVWCPVLEREPLFDAILDRHTYGTTGARMILHFSLDGARVGQGLVGSGTLTSDIRIHGTGELDWVELVRVGPDRADEEVALRWDSISAFDFETRASVPGADVIPSLYYVRVAQKGTYRRRVPMGWTSPIWVTDAEGGGAWPHMPLTGK